MKRIREIGEVITGSTPSTQHKEYYDGEYLFVSPVDIQGNRYVETTKRTLTKEGFSKGRKVDKGSSLFVCIGSTIGKIAQAKIDCVTNQQINSVVPVNHNADFIFSLLSHHSAAIKKLAAEQAVPIINKTTFSNYELYIPTILEQKKIADFLCLVDDRIQKSIKIIEGLRVSKTALSKKIFAHELRFPEFTGEWEPKTLSQLGDFMGGGTPSSTNASFWNGEIPWVSSSDLDEGNIHTIRITRFINEDAINNSATKLCIAPVILIVSRVGVGKVAYSEESLCTSQDFTNIINLKCNGVFLSYLLSIKMKDAASSTQGTSIKGTPSSEIKSQKLLIPKEDEQQKIANFLSAVDEKIEIETAISNLLAKQKQYLLQQMFV